MDKHAVWKWLILIALIAISLAFVTQGIPLGIDIKGGTSFTVQIDEARMREIIRDEVSPPRTDAEVENELPGRMEKGMEQSVEVLRNRVDKLGIAEPVIYRTKPNRVVVQLPGIREEQRVKAKRSIQQAAFLEFRMVHENDEKLVADLFAKKAAPEGYHIVTVGEGNYYQADAGFQSQKGDEEAYQQRLRRFRIPDAGYEFMLERDDIEGRPLYRPHFVNRKPELSGLYLKTAQAGAKQTTGEPEVQLRFDSKGTKVFRQLTTDYAPGGQRNPSRERERYRQLAIVLDGTLYSAPNIIEPIIGGEAQISGRMSVEESYRLANVLRAGSLPAPMKIVEERSVDPTLGAEAVHSGVWAGVYGCTAIIALMAFYYMVPGLLADVALLLNVVLLPLGMIVVAGFLGIFSGGRGGAGPISLPVLTLPGIAGIALTIGMAVDANVLIFERIREELRVGKSFAGAIQAGYERAFTAIFDSNITTIITAIILFILGSGPVRGYAVTLTAGLLVSLYTAVVVTRMCFNAMAAKGVGTKALRMFQMFADTKLDFMRWWKLALTGSVAIIVASWTMMVLHGWRNPVRVFAVDFTGGASVTLGFTNRVSGDAIGAALAEAGLREAMIQYQRSAVAGAAEILQVKVGGGEKEGALVKDALLAKFPDAGFTVLQEDAVGPQVGRELKRKAVWAMVWSLVAMIIYISWRFEFGFALGAVVALFHDVLITAGVAHLLGFQVSLTMVAALLTIVGYSVNDTIVIFDRIRENLRLTRNLSFRDLCNLSMNQTLSRTILTNFLTFVCVLFLVALGGGAIKDFSVTMFVGMVAGTYSTMYIATPIVLLWYRFKAPDLGTKKVK